MPALNKIATHVAFNEIIPDQTSVYFAKFDSGGGILKIVVAS